MAATSNRLGGRRLDAFGHARPRGTGLPITGHYLENMRFLLTLAIAAAAILPAGPALAQPRSAIAIDQIPVRGGSARVNVTPVRGRSSSASAQENANVPTVPPEVIAACRAAQAEDRPPPQGINCIAALQALSQVAAPATAEGTLLRLFGQRSNITGGTSVQSDSSANADAAARQLATGNVDPVAGNGAAVIAGRQRAAPPPTSPR